jgi:hypothetical protein
MELRRKNRSVESIRLGRSPPKNIAQRMTGYITKYQVDNAQFPLVLHSGDLPPDLTSFEQRLGEHVTEVLTDCQVSRRSS